MRLHFAGFLAAVALSACSMTPPPTPEEVYAADQHACTMYGFKPQTDGFAECMMRLDVARAQMQQQQAQFDRARFDASMRALAASSVTCNTSAQVYGNGGFATGNSTTTCR